ncbi:MAG: methyltransferase [Deltaproteobacteria bacterium]|nr:methyltransferase [Deltaproteobacteria bacterium]
MKRFRSCDVTLRPDESIDEFMDGRLKVIQSKKGYRFSVDAILLSEFVSVRDGDRVVDLGAGCGIIPLLLLLTRPIRRVLALEIQPDLAHQAFRNARLNGFAGRMDVVIGDIRAIPISPLSADVVLCNPPYRQKRSGRINPDPQRAIARHEIMMSLEDILGASKRLLRAGGRLAVIYPSLRLAELVARMESHGLEPKRMRLVYPDGESGAKLVLLEATAKGRRGLKVLPPLFEKGAQGARKRGSPNSCQAPSRVTKGLSGDNLEE